MTPVRIHDHEVGPWAVKEDDRLLAWGLETNADAWRWIDLHEGDPLSPAQKRADYGWKKFIDGS